MRNEGIPADPGSQGEQGKALCPSSCGAAAAPDPGLSLRGLSSAFPLRHKEQLPGLAPWEENQHCPGGFSMDLP